MTKLCSVLAIVVTAFAGTLAGCAASETSGTVAAPSVSVSGVDTSPSPAGKTAADRVASARPKSNGPPDIESFSGGARAEVLVCGTVPYDNMTLPQVSPDGRYIATQTGLPPEWDTILAAPGALPPYATHIEIFSVPADAKDPPRMVASVTESVLLGRSCDASGFLVEAPRNDGSRWIGRAAWDTGEVTWLVRNAAVNAFATAASDGTLAWSSVAIDGDFFELVIRRNGEEWRLPSRGNDWLMPTWSSTAKTDGSLGLFAIMLRGDMMDAVHMDASSEERMYRTIQRLPLANRNASVKTAFQSMNPHVVIPGVPPADHDTLTFLHPTRLRCATWTPPGAATILDTGSFAAVVDSNDPAYILMSTMKNLVRRKIGEGRSRSKIIAGPQVARPTPDSGGYVLLNPQDGVIVLTRMRLLRER